MFVEHGTIAARVYRQWRALEQGKMASVIMTVVTEICAGPEADKRLVRAPSGPDISQIQRAPSEQGCLGQFIRQVFESFRGIACRRQDRGIVKERESPAIAAVIAFRAVQLFKMARIGLHDRIPRQLCDHIDDPPRLVFLVDPVTFVSESFYTIVGAGGVDCP